MATPALLLEPDLLLDGPSRDGRMVMDADGLSVATNPQAEAILGLDIPRLKALVADGKVPVTVREDGSLMTRAEQPARVCIRTGEPIRDMVVGIHPAAGYLRWLRVAPCSTGARPTRSSISPPSRSRGWWRRTAVAWRASWAPTRSRSWAPGAPCTPAARGRCSAWS